MTVYRILVTGSRTFLRDTVDHDGLTIDDALDVAAITAADLGFHGLLVVHGDCRDGADAVADEWAKGRRRRGWPVDVERHPANWQGPAGRGAGFARNKHMVSLGADRCFAFVDLCRDVKCRRTEAHGSHGATRCADHARRAGIPVQWRRTPDLPAPVGADTPTA